MAGLFGNVSAEGGFDQSEIDFVTQLINSGQTTIDEVSSTFGVPRDVVASVYAQNAPAEPAQDSLFNDALSATNIIGSIGDIYNNASVAPAAPVSNQGYQSPYALNAAEQPSVNLGKVAGGTNTALQGLSDFNIADSAGAAGAASDVFAGGLGSIISAIGGKESKAESAGLAVLSMFNPAAALAYRIFDALDFFGGGGAKATPMTPEEALKYAGESRLATTLQSQGEGAGELILDAVEQARAANVEPEKIAEALNSSTNPVAGLINLTVGSNQMLSDADMAAAQEAAAAASTDTLGGSTSSLEPDGDLLGTVDPFLDSTASAASTAGTGATVVNTDTEHPWLYEGNGVLRNVFTGEVQTNQSGTENLVVGETYSSGTPTEATTRSNDTTDSGNINVILTPSVTGGTTSTVVNTASTGDSDTTVVDGGGGLDTGDVTITNGNGVETTTGTATPKSTDPTLTVGTPTVTPTVTATPALTPAVTPTPTVINGVDGVAGAAGADGRDGSDGRDGRDGLTGLLTLNSIATPIADEIFKNEFKMDYLKPEFIGLLDLNRGRTS